MRVLLLSRDAGPSWVNRGWQHVLEYAGHEVRYWNREREAAFHDFNAFKPDLFVGTTWDADEALIKLCKKYPSMRVALYAATWGDLADGLDPVEYPIVMAKESEKALIERMKHETGRPDLVWLHVTPTYLEPVLGGWRSIGVKPVGITNAADLFVYSGGEYREEYRCDVAFVGGSWGYKGRMLTPYLGPLLHPDSGLHCKVWGHMTWPHGCYLGLLGESEARHVFRSAAVCPSIGEPHSLIFSDIVERYYKVPAAGGFVIGGPELGLEEEFGSVIPWGETPTRYQELVRYFVYGDPINRQALAEQQRQLVIHQHSYFNRVAQLFRELDLPAEAQQVELAHEKFLKT